MHKSIWFPQRSNHCAWFKQPQVRQDLQDLRAAYAVEGAPGRLTPVEFSNGCGCRDGPLMTGISAAKNGKTMKNNEKHGFGLKLHVEQQGAFVILMRCLVLFGPVCWSTNIRTFWRNFLGLQPSKMVIEPKRDGMKWGTSSKKCDVKPLSSCLVLWDIYMCLPTCIYTYLHVCIYIYLNVSTCISVCFCIGIYTYIYDRETFRYHFVPLNSDKF